MERVRLTADVDGIETDGFGLDQNLVFAWFWNGSVLENDFFPLERRLKTSAFQSVGVGVTNRLDEGLGCSWDGSCRHGEVGRWVRLNRYLLH